MGRLIIRGGYGEHGRSCFLVEYGVKGRMYMVDCGIMDTDPFPYPEVTPEELARVDYLFLTHCHKDHTGAFEYFCGRGFQGTLVTGAMTAKLAGITYEKTGILNVGEGPYPVNISVGPLAVSYGRAGHCPGSLWFEIDDGKDRILFSGDYQENTLVYACDPIRGRQAKMAVIDCAHRDTEDDARMLREKLMSAVEAACKEGRKVILPVPQYGRGLELYVLLKERFPEASICVDPDFAECAKEMLAEPAWYYKEPYETWLSGTFAVWDPVSCKETGKENGPFPGTGFQILLLADTHLKKRENLAFVEQELCRNAAVFVTGRVKKNGPVDRLLAEGRAVKLLFPHHQSRGDLRRLTEKNMFSVILPFHNGEKEVII